MTFFFRLNITVDHSLNDDTRVTKEATTNILMQVT